MYYWGPGFLTVYDLAPPPPSPGSKLSLFLNLSVCRPSSLLTGKGVERGRSQIIRRRECLVLYNPLAMLYSLGGFFLAFFLRHEVLTLSCGQRSVLWVHNEVPQGATWIQNEKLTLINQHKVLARNKYTYNAALSFIRKLLNIWNQHKPQKRQNCMYN